jgi:hypothetical protein
MAGGRHQLLEWGRCVLYWVAANGVEFDGGAHRTECGTGQWLSVLDTSGARRRMAAGGTAYGSPFWLTDGLVARTEERTLRNRRRSFVGLGGIFVTSCPHRAVGG